MAIAFDAESISAWTNIDPIGWNHTPSGTPRGVIVLCVSHEESQTIASVTYGGQTMTRVDGAPFNKVSGEGSCIDIFILGSNIPTGVQAVSVNQNGGTWRCACITLTAAGDVIQQSYQTIQADVSANPAIATLALSEESCFVVEAFGSGQSDPINYTPLTDWTEVFEQDASLEGFGVYRYDIVGTNDVTVGLNNATDDINLLAIAIRETEQVFIHSFGIIIE